MPFRLRLDPRLLAATVLLACATTAAKPPPAAAETSAGSSTSAAVDQGPEAFRRLLDEIWDSAMALHPETVTWVGDPRYNDRWSDLTPEAIHAEEDAKRRYLARLDAFDPSLLPDEDRITREMLTRELRLDLEEARFDTWTMPLNTQFGLHVIPAGMPALLPFKSAKDYDDWIRRLRAIPKLFAELEANLRVGIAKGRVPPRYIVQKLTDPARRLAAAPADHSPFAAPLARMPGDVPDPEKQRIRAELVAAVEQDVNPAYARLARFLDTEYMAAARTEDGIWSIPDGDAVYALDVRRMTTTSLTPDEIHAIGLREVARIEREMLGIARARGFSDLASFNAALEKDPALRPRSAEQLLQLYRGYIDAVSARLPQLFGRLPKAPVVVEAIEPYREKEAAGAEYRIPAPSRPGVVVVNTGELEKRKLVGVEATAYHEGVPGHHMQLAIAQELAMHPLRRHGGPAAFVEGWGLYAEGLGKEIGMYADPISNYGPLEAEIWRAIRLVVDTGVHAKRWSRQQVVDYFRAHSSIDEVDIQAETDRYISWPGQALAYMIGNLKIRELRERARTALGPAFDVRAFHDEVLGSGALPLDVLERQIDRWIAARRSPPAPPPR